MNNAASVDHNLWRLRTWESARRPKRPTEMAKSKCNCSSLQTWRGWSLSPVGFHVATATRHAPSLSLFNHPHVGGGYVWQNCNSRCCGQTAAQVQLTWRCSMWANIGNDTFSAESKSCLDFGSSGELRLGIGEVPCNGEDNPESCSLWPRASFKRQIWFCLLRISVSLDWMRYLMVTFKYLTELSNLTFSFWLLHNYMQI